MMSNALTGITMAQDGSDAQGAAIAFALMGLCAVAFVLTRGNAVRRTFATSHHMAESELQLLKNVAAAQRGRTALFIAACWLVLAGITALPIASEARLVLSVTPAMLLGIGIFALTRLQTLASLRAEPALRIQAHGHYLFASRGRRLVGWVAAPPRLVARANRLPVATVRT